MEESSASKGLFNWLVLALLIAILFAVLVYYTLNIVTQTKAVVLEQAQREFQRTSMQVHGKWLATKGQSVELTQLDAKLNKSGSTVFEVNESGWPVAVIGVSGERCMVLLKTMQTQELTSNISAKSGANMRCEYFVDDKPWFYFDPSLGRVHKKVL